MLVVQWLPLSILDSGTAYVLSDSRGDTWRFLFRNIHYNNTRALPPLKTTPPDHLHQGLFGNVCALQVMSVNSYTVYRFCLCFIL